MMGGDKVGERVRRRWRRRRDGQQFGSPRGPRKLSSVEEGSVSNEVHASKKGKKKKKQGRKKFLHLACIFIYYSVKNRQQVDKLFIIKSHHYSLLFIIHNIFIYSSSVLFYESLKVKRTVQQFGNYNYSLSC